MCGTTSVNKVNTPATVSLSTPVNSKKNANSNIIVNNNLITIATTNNNKPTHISLEGISTGPSAIDANYPPSPPEMASAVITVTSKPLTMANVAAIPASSYSSISTPPTSDSSSGSSEGLSASEISFSSSSSSPEAPAAVQSSEAELEFLDKVFGAKSNATFAQHGVQVSPMPAEAAEELVFPGAILEESAASVKAKTLYVAPQPSSQLTKDALIELMDLAIDELECTGIVICLRKGDEELGETLHELLYVGGAIVSPDSTLVGFNSNDYVLVGLDL